MAFDEPRRAPKLIVVTPLTVPKSLPVMASDSTIPKKCGASTARSEYLLLSLRGDSGWKEEDTSFALVHGLYWLVVNLVAYCLSPMDGSWTSVSSSIGVGRSRLDAPCWTCWTHAGRMVDGILAVAVLRFARVKRALLVRCLVYDILARKYTHGAVDHQAGQHVIGARQIRNHAISVPTKGEANKAHGNQYRGSRWIDST